MKVLKFVLILLLVIILILAGSIVVMYALAKTDPNENKYNINPSLTAIKKSLESTIINNEVKITNQEVNEFLAYCVEQGYFSFKGNSDVIIKTINADIQAEDNVVIFYIAYDYKGNNYGLTAKVNFTFNSDSQQFIALIQELKIGKLKLPVKLTLSFIKDIFPENININNDTIYINYLGFPLQNENTNIINIESFRISNRSVYIKLEKAGDIVNNYLKDLIKNGLSQGERYLSTLINEVTPTFEE